MKINTEQVIKIIRKVAKEEEKFLPLHAPTMQGNEWRYVKECIDENWVSSAGKYVDLFEEKLATFTGVKRAVAVMNGTAALHVSLLASGVKQSDEVLLPSLTFIATANAVAYCGAVPHFIDVEQRTLGVDVEKLDVYLKDICIESEEGCINKKTGRLIKAVIAMHTFGHPVELFSLKNLCDKYGIVLIEDAAESLGSYYKGIHTGNIGKVAAVSFNGNKIMTTGGGGAVLTNDEKLADYIKHITTTAKVRHQWEYVHDEIGFNYRLPNINAALGVAQLEKLPDFLKAKRKLADAYKEAFQKVKYLDVFEEPEFARSNHWLNVILLNQDVIDERDHLLQALNDHQIMSRPIWKPLHKLSMYEDNPKMNLSGTEYLEKRIINIPSSSDLGGFL